MPLILIHLESATALAQLSCELNKITYVSGLSSCGEQSHQCNHCPTRILYKVKVNDAMEIAKKKPKQPKIFLFPLSIECSYSFSPTPLPPSSEVHPKERNVQTANISHCLKKRGLFKGTKMKGTIPKKLPQSTQ